MFSDIKRLLIKKYKNELDDIKRKEERLKELEILIKNGEFELVPVQTFNIFQKILRTKSYRKHLEYIKQMKKKRELRKQQQIEEKEALKKDKEKREKKLEQILVEYNKIIVAKQWNDLGINFSKAVKLLNENQIPISIEPKDNIKKYYSKGKITNKCLIKFTKEKTGIN